MPAVLVGATCSVSLTLGTGRPSPTVAALADEVLKAGGLKEKLPMLALIAGLVMTSFVTFVASRVPGKVLEVFVDDNKRVKKGDLLVHIDPEPFQVQVNLKRAAVEVATEDLAAAESQARGLEALARSQRWKIQSAAQQVNSQIALLKARAAVLRPKEATLDRARADFERARRLVQTGATSREDFDQRQQDIRVAEASVN